MRYLLPILLLLPVVALAHPFDDVDPDPHRRWHVRLRSGDILTGTVVDILDGTDEAIKLRTAIGVATIYASQVAEIVALDRVYPHAHRLFFMPTAEPIRNNLYIGLYELLLPYGGIGWDDVLSVTMGRTVVPGLSSDEQALLAGAKVTLYDRTDNGETLQFAAGLHTAWLNTNNSLVHLFGTGTWGTERLALTGMVFVKAGGRDDATVRAGEYGNFRMRYTTGTVGAGVGFDMPFGRSRPDIRLVAEVWCSDLTTPANTAAIIGLRLWNTDIAADFGLAVFPLPGVAPVLNVVWTPRIRS